MDREEIRKPVLAQVIDVMAAADADGIDPLKAARTTFPGTPEDVLCAAWVEFEDSKTEAWWQRVERTIDGEIARKAMALGNGETK